MTAKTVTQEEFDSAKRQGYAEIRDGVAWLLYDDDVFGTTWGPVELKGMVACAMEGCRARFFFVHGRRYPGLCLDHADDQDRIDHGWTPTNSID